MSSISRDYTDDAGEDDDATVDRLVSHLLQENDDATISRLGAHLLEEEDASRDSSSASKNKRTAPNFSSSLGEECQAAFAHPQRTFVW